MQISTGLPPPSPSISSTAHAQFAEGLCSSLCVGIYLTSNVSPSTSCPPNATDLAEIKETVNPLCCHRYLSCLSLAGRVASFDMTKNGSTCTNSASPFTCPCTNIHHTLQPAAPSFVGHDYFCDTGSENEVQNIFYRDDPLWDGAGCGPFSTCCSWNSPPWFRKELSPPTSDDIEMRLCSDEDESNENVYIRSIEMYVQ